MNDVGRTNVVATPASATVSSAALWVAASECSGSENEVVNGVGDLRGDSRVD